MLASMLFDGLNTDNDDLLANFLASPCNTLSFEELLFDDTIPPPPSALADTTYGSNRAKRRRKMPASMTAEYRQLIDKDYSTVTAALNNMRRQKRRAAKLGQELSPQFKLLFSQACSRYSQLYREKRRIEENLQQMDSLPPVLPLTCDVATQTE